LDLVKTQNLYLKSSTVRTARISVRMIVYNWVTQYSTAQF